jgi:hypothetical protein
MKEELIIEERRHQARIVRQQRYRARQRQTGVPPGEVIAMAVTRRLIAECINAKRYDALNHLLEAIIEDLRQTHYHRTLSKKGIRYRFDSLFDGVDDNMASYAPFCFDELLKKQ